MHVILRLFSMFADHGCIVAKESEVYLLAWSPPSVLDYNSHKTLQA